MNEQIKQIAERLAGLRDALEITPEEMAGVCNLTPEQYMKRYCRYFSKCTASDFAGLRRRADDADVRRRAKDEQLFHYP